MYRKAIESLQRWKEKADRKPLILRGARQVGKTWLMKEFGKRAYKHTIYINLDDNRQMRELFASDLNIERIILGLELYSGGKINPQNTLLIFDEVQEVPNTLTSLKYFNENAPQYQIMCAGSLLGVALHKGTSFPVGKVEFLDLYPLSFCEFLLAMGKEQFADLIHKKNFDMIRSFKDTYIEFLRYYYYVGGMPEAVFAFSQRKDFNEVRIIQQRILSSYEQDFSKHAPHDVVPKIRLLWNSIPSQLARENKKFMFGIIKEGARAREYEYALLWLCDCGLVHKVYRVTVPNIPLRAYEDPKAFKLFLLDVGLLSCMARLRQDVLLNGSDLFKEFKGALTEQYVLQQFKASSDIDTYYWSSGQGTAEIDFVIDGGKNIIPVEVKAEQNLQAKSLKSYREKYGPKISIRASMADYRQDDGLVNLPLYAIEAAADFL